jgi:hypothetical protein
VASGDHAQAAGVFGKWVEVEGDLDMAKLAVPAIGVPAGIADIVVAIAAHVVEVIATERLGDAEDSRVVEESAEPGMMVKKLRDTRAGRPFVGPTRVTTAIGLPDRLETVDDLVNTVREKARKANIAESLKKAPLLLVHALIVADLDVGGTLLSLVCGGSVAVFIVEFTCISPPTTAEHNQRAPKREHCQRRWLRCRCWRDSDSDIVEIDHTW